jgi:Tfp pilus assembly protein PilF
MSPSDSATALPIRTLTGIVVYLALAVLTVTAYAPLLAGGYEFLNFDDDEYVTANPHVQGGLTKTNLRWALTTYHANNWHPLTWMSLQMDYELYGLRPRGYHATNLLLHTANVLLLFAALRCLTGSIWRSAWVAALFAVHPLHVESVAWVAERKDVLSTFFWMLTLLAYARYAERPGVGRYLLVALALALGLAAKPMLVTLPCVLLLLDWWPLGRFQPKEGETAWTVAWRLVREKLPLFFLVTACSVLTMRAQEQTRLSLSLPLAVRVENALVSYATYARQMIWPGDLAVFYPHSRTGLPPAQVVGAAILLLTVTVLAWRLRRSRPYVAVGWLWYLGTLVPVIGLVQVGNQARADRYTYIPLIGLFLLVVWGSYDVLARWRVPRPAAGLAAAGALAACIGYTWLYLPFWRDSLALWRHAEAVTAANPFPHLGQAKALESQGQDVEADRQYRLALDMRPVPPQFHTIYGVFLEKQNRLPEARAQFELAINGNPNDAVAHFRLGDMCDLAGRSDEAGRHYAAVLRVQPDNEEAHYNLGILCQRQSKWDEACTHFESAVRLRPDDAEAHAHLGLALMMQNYLGSARSELERALALDSRIYDAYINLGAIACNEREWDQARQHFLSAVKINPSKVEAHNNLGFVFLMEGKLDEARKELHMVLKINPQHAGAHELLANICERAGQMEEARHHQAEFKRIQEQARQIPAGNGP